MRISFLAAAVVLALGGLAMGQTPEKLKYYYPLAKAAAPENVAVDVVVYGGTSGGVTAAIQAARMGKKVALVEFGSHIGGLTTGGLSATDGGKSAGGIAREFYQAVGQRGFPPAKAEAQFRAMLKEANVAVYTERRLASVRRDGKRIVSMTDEGGNTYRAAIFIDATYEGDLMAAAGVSFAFGREANAIYGETLNGISTPGAHNFNKPVDPYVTPGDPKSGLLPLVSAAELGKPGDGDKLIQAYNFRMYFEANGRPFAKPDHYDPQRYALLLRFMAAGGGPGIYPHAGDNNNQGGFSTDHIGANYDWPDGPSRGDLKAVRDAAYFHALYEAREKVFQDHVTYQMGLCYFLANDPQVSEETRAKMKAWGLSTTDFAQTGGWPHQLYVREGRRLIGEYVMTQANCTGKEVAADSVGLAEYNMDSHNCQRIVIEGKVRNEGDVQVRVKGPYPVSYRAIVPKAEECGNLLVPVALSASHIAYGSIRMEPVFMVVGQSAGTAASLALEGNVGVQKVPYEKLRERLLKDRQLLEAGAAVKN